jgi:hypothetical protein
MTYRAIVAPVYTAGAAVAGSVDLPIKTYRRSIPCTSQPQVTPQFSQYWLDRGLQCVTVGQKVWVRGSGGWVTTEPGTTQATQEGQAVHDLRIYNSDYQKIPLGTEQSIFALAIPGVNLNGYTAVVAGTVYADPTRGGIEIGIYDNSHNWYFVSRSPTFSANQTLTITNNIASAGTMSKLCYRSSAIGTPYHSLNIDGGSATINTIFAAAGANIVDSMTVGLSTVGGGTVAVPLFARFNVALTDEEFASLCHNPWQLFAPITKQLPTVAATISMPTVKRRSVPWTSQPQVPVGVNWANPLSRSLTSLIYFKNGVAYDAVSNQLFSHPTFDCGEFVTSQGVAIGKVQNTAGAGIPLPGFFQRSVFTRVFVATGDGHTGDLLSESGTTTGNARIQANGNSFELDQANVANYINVTGAGASPACIGFSVGSAIQTGWRDGIIQASRSGSVSFTHAGTGYLLNGTFDAKPYLLMHADFDRALNDAEMASVTANPWQLFAPLSRQLPLITSTIGRPNSDIFVSGWSWTGTTLSNSIGETTPDDTSYATSPDILSSPYFTAGLNIPLFSGSYSMNVRSKIRTGSGSSTMTVYLLDNTDAIVGTGAGRAITGGTVTLYQIPITVIGTATKVKVALT